MKPSQLLRTPVLGRLTAQLVLRQEDGTDLTFPADHYEFIKVVETGDQTFYVVDAWNSPGVPQLVPGFCVTDLEYYDDHSPTPDNGG